MKGCEEAIFFGLLSDSFFVAHNSLSVHGFVALIWFKQGLSC